ncbi:MAG: hypothetical protein ABI405_13650 [Parafilimonas sp.]
MKKKLFLLCSCLVVVSAYSQKVLSLNSLFAEPDAVLVPGIEGAWVVTDFNVNILINKAGDNFYVLKYGSEKNESTFEAAFVKIKDEIFLDLSGVMPDSIGDDDYRNGFIKSHSIYKVRMTKDTLQLSELNYAWFYNYVAKKQLPLKYEWTDNAMLLTLKTADLKFFFSEHNDEKEMFENSITLISNHAGVVKETIINKNNSGSKSPAAVLQNCTPEFPLQNGWLGGDGAVSVPISATTTLFIFSDSYVGNKNQQSRQEPGMKMVSNTVAVETCLPNGKTDVKYFWNNMYSENPEPVFKSFTNRYKFWVNDAFMAGDNLYVLLQKVGIKSGMPPDDFFPFSLPGFSLAKIINPFDLPDKWKIELIPFPDFAYPDMQLGLHVIKDNYVYFFVSRNDNAQLLVRKRIDFIDDPAKPFEYYSLNKTWQIGIKKDDMDTVFNGFRTVTVNYHPDIKQWVMLSDIKFMDNKIKMRTAPALTGPWSDEIIIYEIPEVTVGSPFYSKSNFCYLPAEWIQNYDVKKQEMLITYNINNSNFSEINANPKIYTPKIITVSLKKKYDKR